MKKILLIFYSLSSLFARGKKDLILNGAWVLIFNVLIFNSVTLLLFLIWLTDIRLNKLSAICVTLGIGVIIQIGLKNLVLKKIQTLKISEQFNKSNKKGSYSLLGLLLLIISFFMIFIVGALLFSMKR